MNSLQKMLEKSQQVVDKINRVQKMLEKSQQVVDKINRTLECKASFSRLWA